RPAPERAPRLRDRAALLPRRQPRAPGDPHHVRGAAPPPARHRARGPGDAAPLQLHRRHQAHAGEVHAAIGVSVRTRVCDTFGLEFPIFAFSHCRDVVPAVSKAAGLGVLVALGPPSKLLVNALGTRPRDVVGKVHARGVLVAALIGTAEHARRQVEAGVDIVIASGNEAGGHTGEIATLVLVPEVVDAVAPTPVLAAGGIGCGRQVAATLALGADGAWTGSIWLASTESDLHPVALEKVLKATSRD